MTVGDPLQTSIESALRCSVHGAKRRTRLKSFGRMAGLRELADLACQHPEEHRGRGFLIAMMSIELTEASSTQWNAFAS
ncbi:hypothetical protein [Hansschlegelia sp. KR7-227]|uniref:hypothetical protein n=1 Tax=Hansschlegelia sp. KR7-227 TaxID=3400914 RepID=UPI003C0DA71C